MLSKLNGRHHEIAITDPGYPARLARTDNPPEAIYAIGNADILGRDSIAIVGAHNATHYGRGCAARFARIASQCGFFVVSGDAQGIDATVHKAALEAGMPTVAVLAGGLDYPHAHAKMLQEIIDSGGCVISEQPWDMPPRPCMFKNHSRIIAGLAHATLVVEALLPSGSFSCAEYAFDANREVWAVPGNITSDTSRGTNELLLMGAKPITDGITLIEALEHVNGK